LQSVDHVGEAEPAIIIAIVAAHPCLNVLILDIRSLIEVEQERSEVVFGDLSVGELVNAPEDRENAVVKLVNQVLLQMLHFLDLFNFPAFNFKPQKVFSYLCRT
jgi:hypothetical protein